MESGFMSPREIVRLNIEHYGRLLRTSLSEETRRTVEHLLAEEKAKLVKFSKAQASEPVARARPASCNMP